MNKNDFEDLRKQISSWSLKPARLIMHPETWDSFLAMDIIDLYVAILKYGCKVDSCKEVRPNVYEISIDSKWGGTFTLKPRA